jgi:hypothetical protein
LRGPGGGLGVVEGPAGALGAVAGAPADWGVDHADRGFDPPLRFDGGLGDAGLDQRDRHGGVVDGDLQWLGHGLLGFGVGNEKRPGPPPEGTGPHKAAPNRGRSGCWWCYTLAGSSDAGRHPPGGCAVLLVAAATAVAGAAGEARR